MRCAKSCAESLQSLLFFLSWTGKRVTKEKPPKSHDSHTRSRISRMPGSKRAIGDILRGKRDDGVSAFDADMADVLGNSHASDHGAVGEHTAGSHETTKTTTTTVTTTTISATPDLDQARRLLFGWSLRGFLETRPPSTVVTLGRTCTIGEALKVLGRHGILSAPVVDNTTGEFHGFASCLDITHAFIDGLDPALCRSSYTDGLTREQRMAELDGIAEDFLSSHLTKIHLTPDGKLVFKGHENDATLLDVVSHGFFHTCCDGSDSSQHTKSGAHTTHRMTHECVIEPAPPLTVAQRDARVEASQARLRDSPTKNQPDDFAVAAAIEQQAFVRTVGVCHRLAVFDHDTMDGTMRVCAIVSQLDILRFLSRKFETGSALADATLRELGLVSKIHEEENEEVSLVNTPGATGDSEQNTVPVGCVTETSKRVTRSLTATRTTITRHGSSVVTAPWDASALTCFKLMRDKNVSAVGIVDQNDELVANLSASDLRRLGQNSFRMLALPVAEFISRRKGDAIGRCDAPFAEARMLFGENEKGTVEKSKSRSSSQEISDRTFVELVFARPTTTLRDVLQRFNTHSIHHVYVVDKHDRPIAVLTPTDILRVFAVDDDDSKWKDAWHGGGEVVA